MPGNLSPRTNKRRKALFGRINMTVLLPLVLPTSSIDFLYSILYYPSPISLLSIIPSLEIPGTSSQSLLMLHHDQFRTRCP